MASRKRNRNLSAADREELLRMHLRECWLQALREFLSAGVEIADALDGLTGPDSERQQEKADRARLMLKRADGWIRKSRE